MCGLERLLLTIPFQVISYSRNPINVVDIANIVLVQQKIDEL